jgi:uncharacterized damage-inducible protein DinB
MTPETTTDAVTRIDRAWAELEATVAALSPYQLTEARDPAGWAVKDHLIHVAVWADAFLARLDGRPLHEALGIGPTPEGADEDAINAAIFARHRERPAADVLDALRAAHRAVRARLAETPAGEGPTLEEIAGNTWEHYEAHRGWIRGLAAPASS